MKCRFCKNNAAVVVKEFDDIENQYPLCGICGLEPMFEFGITSVRRLGAGGEKKN